MGIHLKLVLINHFSSPSFFICDLSGEGSENSHLMRMPTAVSGAEALVLVAGECPEHWTLVACGLRTQHTVSRWCDTAASRRTDSGQSAMLPFGLVHIMFSIFCAHIELLSLLVFTLEKLFRYLIILTSIFNHDTCYCNKLDFKH